MGKFADHPGFLGFTSAGVILIHADWPAYAVDHGWQNALLSLGQFPQGTTFQMIDDIDRCYLFFVGDPSGSKDKFDKRHFHVAIWHVDLLSLADKGYINGVRHVTYRQWAVERAKELKGKYYTVDGVKRSVPTPTAEDFDDSEAMHGLVQSQGISITQVGLGELEILLGEKDDLISADIRRLTKDLVGTGRFDTAIREASLLLEVEMKASIGSDLFGAKLVDSFFGAAMESRKLIPAQLKTFRTDVRACFSFVRNDFMHNFRNLTATQCKAILVRISRVHSGIGEIKKLM